MLMISTVSMPLEERYAVAAKCHRTFQGGDFLLIVRSFVSGLPSIEKLHPIILLVGLQTFCPCKRRAGCSDRLLSHFLFARMCRPCSAVLMRQLLDGAGCMVQATRRENPWRSPGSQRSILTSPT